MMMVCAQRHGQCRHYGHDQRSATDNFELNVMMPVMVYNVHAVESICSSYAERMRRLHAPSASKASTADRDR